MTDERKARNRRTIAAQGGMVHDSVTGAVSLPIHMSTTYERGANGELVSEFMYGRYDNPTRQALEKCLAELEGGAEAAAFASGLAATMTVFQTLASGDHVIAPSDGYHGTLDQLRTVFNEWGLTSAFVDMTDLDAVTAAFNSRTRLVWFETPSNPLMRVTDIERVTEAAHARGARVAVDNTFATPMLQNPLELGADIVMHSTTKYISGHSDVMGGAVVTRALDPTWERIRKLQRLGGAIPSPFDSWLVLRGIRTLPLRMRAHSDTAMQVAKALAANPKISAVHYPGLESHPGHEVAKRQMSDFGGMMSIQVRGGRSAALRALSRVELFRRATSLGGTESLIEHRASVEGPLSRTPDDLLRLSVGLEDVSDVLGDLEHALAG